MNLHESPDLFKDVLIASAKYLKINELFIEKDYWITFILKTLNSSKFKDKVVFKGGTSLSKGFQLIDRFSEDIDLALLEIEKFSQNQIKKLIKEIETYILRNPLKELPEHPQVSKGSRIRKTVFQYPVIFKNLSYPSTIILELNSFANPIPFEPRNIATLIYDFLKNQEPSLIKEFHLEPFPINVLSIKRTFCEKISAVARASFTGDENLKNKIRHLYDIYKLLKIDTIKNFIVTSEFSEMVQMVRIDDLKKKGFDRNWQNKKFSEAPVFINEDNLKRLEKAFNTQLSNIIIKDMPSFSDVLSSFKKLKDILTNLKI